MALPKILRDRIDILIRTGAAELKLLAPSEYERGLRNQTIRDHILDRAVAILARHHSDTVDAYLSTRIAVTLAKRDELHAFQPCIPELKLPEWLNVPSAIDGGVEYGGWKLEADTTPNELQRLIDHREQIIRGHEVEREKYLLLRATALERGCGPDEPVRNVFFRPLPPEPPHAHA